MKFRTRLLILLLIVALVPLCISFLVQRTSVLHFGNKLAEDTRTLLNNGAQNLLHALVDDYGRILSRDRTMALLTLQNQAQAVESILAQPPPEPAKIFFAEDYNIPERQPADLSPSQKHFKTGENGDLEAIAVSYDHQVIYLPGGTVAANVRQDLARLSHMTGVYRSLNRIQPNLFLWQYTALESGIHSSYPGKGGYPDDYDPRQRSWYRDALNHDDATQGILIDVTTGRLILTLSMPVHNPDGSPAGVTALDIDYRQFFTDWNIPVEWADATESMVLIYHDETDQNHGDLEILLRSNSNNLGQDWRMPVKREFLDLDTPELTEIRQDMEEGTSAVRRVVYRGEETLWAYGSRQGHEPFPLLIVPYKRILARADDAEQYVNRQISMGLTISAVLTIMVVCAAILLALIRSRKVTRPVMQLATAADRLAEGDFDARVTITTGDELEELGKIFNSLGVRLREREQMKQSLDLAKEIQQELLPAEVPHLPGFDLAGQSIYCDETGGDYFDFIRINNSNSLGLAVGDVSGHGIGSALVMATARGALHSLIGNNKTDLPALLSQLNRYLNRGTADSYFMTLFYGLLDSEQQTLSWISAGHAPLFLYQQGTMTELESSGIPLGIEERAAYAAPATIHFEKGDILFIGTDGIWETRNSDGDMFGTDRIRQLLEKHKDRSARDIAGIIIDAVNHFRGDAAIDDDVTLMVIKAQGIDSDSGEKHRE